MGIETGGLLGLLLLIAMVWAIYSIFQSAASTGAKVLSTVLIILVPVVLAFRAERQKREMEQAERMRAIELGRPIPGEDGWWTPARMAVGIGVGSGQRDHDRCVLRGSHVLAICDRQVGNRRYAHRRGGR